VISSGHAHPALRIGTSGTRQHGKSARWLVRALAVAVLAAGVVDLISASTAEIETRVEVVKRYVPDVLPTTAKALTNVVGVGLILLVPGLLRRKQRAMVLAIAFLGASLPLHLLKGGDYEEAIATTVVALALLLRRRDFYALGDPARRPHLLATSFGLVVMLYVYGASVLVLHTGTTAPGTLVAEVTRRLLGAPAAIRDGHPAGAWFPWSLRLVAFSGAAGLLWLALRPWRAEQAAVERDRSEAQALVARYGTDTLSYFALRHDKRYHYSADRSAFLAYRLIAGVAVVSGDPVGAEASVGDCLDDFLDYAAQRAWTVAVLGAAKAWLPRYAERGLRAHYEGDEAVALPAEFSLEGRSMRKVRQSVTRLERLGYEARVRQAAEIGPGLRRAMDGIAELWRGDERETGFSMAMDSIFAPDGEEDASTFVIAVDADSIPQGFLHFVPASAGHAISLSSMRRYRDTPNGLNEFLIVRAIEWAAANGIERVSLNFSAFAALLGEPGDFTGVQRVERSVLLRLQGRFQLTRLRTFNEKFQPRWEPRYVIYPSGASLPRVALAAMLAEGYLRLPTRVGGRGPAA
jgi:lysyl-tRNA synthetase, class II